MDSIIQIGTIESIVGIAVIFVGIGIAWGKLNISVGSLKESVSDIKKLINEEIKPDLRDIRERFFAFQGKITESLENKSPLRLQDKGFKILDDSGLKKYIDENKSELVELCKKQETRNPYDLQVAIFDFFDDYQFTAEQSNKFKIYAYNSGIDMGMLKRIGAIYLRDICFEEMGINVNEAKHSSNINN